MLPEVDPRRDPRHRRRRAAVPDLRARRRVRHGAHRARRCRPTRRYAHGIVSRVVPADELDATAREMAEKIAASPAVTIKMARRVLRHLSEAEVRSSMADEMIYQTFIAKSDDLAEFRAARAEGRDAALHRELTMVTVDDLPGLPEPPDARRERAARRAPSTASRCSSPAAAPASARRSRSEFARLGASIVIASRKPEHLEAGHEAIAALGAPVDDRRLRHPRSRADRRRVRRRRADAFGLPGRADQQRGRQLPGAGRGHVAQRVAHGRRHHPQRHVLLRTRVRPPAPRGGDAGLDRQRRRVVRVDRRSRASRTPRRPRRA